MTKAWFVALFGIVVFIAAAIIGPFFSMPTYSSVSNILSELAGQNMPNAWIMRTGFVGFGAGVLLASAMRWRAEPFTFSALTVFGAAMIAAAIWSHLPIDPSLGGVQLDAKLHSVAASTMGVAISFACVAHLWRARHAGLQWYAWTTLAAALFLPLLMLQLPVWDGVFQRIMFAISFGFILLRTTSKSAP